MIRRWFCVVRKMDILLPNKVLNTKEILENGKINRDLFQKIIKIPQLKFDPKVINVHKVTPLLKQFYLRMQKLKPLQKERILLNPNVVKSFQDLPVDQLKEVGIVDESFIFDEITLTYDNWGCDDLVKAVIPDDLEPSTSFSQIGHIVHLNLRDHLIPYKYILGQIIRDKVTACETVINKAQTIDTTYRNFQIELLCGEPKYEVQVKENGSFFDFDFSQVYWNPRLSSEHERLVKILNSGDVLYDVFAGVGPFTIPAARKKVSVLANDLNPHSHKWLAHNIKKNKVTGFAKPFMMDGREFISNEVKKDLLEKIKNSETVENPYRIHIAMNLPAMAVEFLDTFLGLLRENDLRITDLKSLAQPLVHVYCFVKGLDCDKKEMAKQLAEENLIDYRLDKCLKEITFVRNVAPNKDMMRVSFYLTNEILFAEKRGKRGAEDIKDPSSVPAKKLCNNAFYEISIDFTNFFLDSSFPLN